jgi:hypothetical protein
MQLPEIESELSPSGRVCRATAPRVVATDELSIAGNDRA